MKNNEIESIPCSWSDKIVMICSKCGNQFEDAKAKEAPERLRSELKAMAKTEMGASVRVLLTSCLGMCPEKKLAFAIADKKSENVFKAYALPADTSAKTLLELLKA
jgi:predicted metal-binding protein